MYVYDGFVCSAPVPRPIAGAATQLDYSEMCANVDMNNIDFVMLSEIVEKPTPFYIFWTSSTREERINVLKQILYSLWIAQKSFRFSHCDLHGNNILVQELPDYVVLKYDIPRASFEPNPERSDSVTIRTRFVAKIIDYGMSDVHVQDSKWISPINNTPPREPQIYAGWYTMFDHKFMPLFDICRLLDGLTDFVHIFPSLKDYSGAIKIDLYDYSNFTDLARRYNMFNDLNE